MASVARLSTKALRGPTATWSTVARRSIYLDPAIQPHQHIDHVPFNYLNKKKFTAVFATVLSFGFALPFVAVGWRWYRPGGLKNP